METTHEYQEEIEEDIVNRVARERFGIPGVTAYQRLVINNILSAAGIFGKELKDEVPAKEIVILPTGAGKSLCFMLPASLLEGPTLVIFPLLSLMADQKRRVEEAGMEAGILQGGQTKEERESLWNRVIAGKIQLVLTNPETALSSQVFPKLKEVGFSHLVVDEAHTVTEWGRSFRPVYLELGRLIHEAGIPIVTAFTATASDVIMEGIKSILFKDDNPFILAGNPDRINIRYDVIPVLSKNHALMQLASSVERPAIIFCSSRSVCEKTVRMLRLRLKDDKIFFYHAGLSKEEKKKIEEWFFDSNDGILVATCAYGMGVDKSNIRTVIHHTLSPSVESYLQESGRGGRDRKDARAILLYSPEDFLILKRKEGEERLRYRKLLEFAKDTKTCRRENLLALLNAKPEFCSGCDVCDQRVIEEDPNTKVIEKVLNTRSRRLNEAEKVLLLQGSRNVIARNNHLNLYPGFGVLQGWETGDIEEVLFSISVSVLVEENLKPNHFGIFRR